MNMKNLIERHLPIALAAKMAMFAGTMWLAPHLHSHALAAQPPFTAFSSGEASIIVSHAGEDYLRFGMAVWGPKWSWTGITGKTRSEGGAAVGTLTAKVGDSPLHLGFHAARVGVNRLELSYELKAEADTELTMFVVELAPGKVFQGREVMVETKGKQAAMRFPFDRGGLGERVSTLRLTDPAGGQTVVRFEPACEITADGAARIVLAKDRLLANEAQHLAVSIGLPGPTDWFASAAELPEEAGIYVKLSAHFGTLKLGPADKQYVPFLEEFGPFKNGRIETPHSAIHYSPDLQQVQILQIVNLLKHTNSYTGLTYASDPAFAFVEIINEQSILFFSSMIPLKASPTLRIQTGRRFCAWLRQKYGSQEKLSQAWCPAAFDCFAGDGFKIAGEHLDKDN